jgi:hypothetical protein
MWQGVRATLLLEFDREQPTFPHERRFDPEPDELAPQAPGAAPPPPLPAESPREKAPVAAS